MSEIQNGYWTELDSVPVLDEQIRWSRITGLSVAYKKRAWAEINTNSPALANLLREPELHALVAQFDADILVESHIVPSLPPEYLKGRSES